MNVIAPSPIVAAAPSLAGRGLYAPGEAARLIDVSAQKLRRWLRGYAFGGGTSWSPPLWSPDVVTADGELYLGFRDLIEARVVASFLAAGISLQSIRKVIVVARSAIGDSHPLSTARFRTDGKSIFLEIAGEGDPDDATLVDLLKSQYAFKRMLDPALRDVTFEGGVPKSWRPFAEAPRVVIDPERSFGQPVDAAAGVPAAVLALAAVSEGSIEAAARAYEVPLAAVRDAVAFERRFAA